MHEIGLMQQAMELALECAARNGGRRIHRITLRVGAFSGVVPEALAFAFDAVAHGTIAEGARLDLECVPAVCFCASCGQEFEPPDVIFDCPRCRQPSAELRRGRELELASLEVS
jgi:hydrogenase nickel incorporation protein HypA/HybF